MIGEMAELVVDDIGHIELSDIVHESCFVKYIVYLSTMSGYIGSNGNAWEPYKSIRCHLHDCVRYYLTEP